MAKIGLSQLGRKKNWISILIQPCIKQKNSLIRTWIEPQPQNVNLLLELPTRFQHSVLQSVFFIENWRSAILHSRRNEVTYGYVCEGRRPSQWVLLLQLLTAMYAKGGALARGCWSNATYGCGCAGRSPSLKTLIYLWN